MSFWTGTPESFEQRSMLGGQQQGLLNQLVSAGKGQGAGGAFGGAADYYRSLLGDNNSTYQAMAAPEMRQFQQEIVPSLANQFAGMGSGALNSSGFRNAAVQQGQSLAERLAGIRAGLRQQGAQGLQSIGQAGLGQYYQNMFRPATPGFLQAAAPIVGKAIGSFGGPALGELGGQFGQFIGNQFKK